MGKLRNTLPEGGNTHLHGEDAPTEAGVHAFGVFDHILLSSVLLLRFLQLQFSLPNLHTAPANNRHKNSWHEADCL